MKKLLNTIGGIGLILPVVALLALPLLVNGQVAPPPPPATDAPSSVAGLINLLRTILFWVSTIFWIAAIFFILYAAFLYLTAGGDDAKVKKAGSQFLYAVVAVAVALLATVIPTLVQNFLRGQ